MTPTSPRTGGPPPSRPDQHDLVFNVVWTGTTFGLLHPFTTSLVRHSGARFRFVVNACPAEEVRAMARYAEDHPARIVEVLEVSTDVMLRHGTALDRVLAARDDGPYFCFVDPDILARGPWLPPLLDTLAGGASVTSGKELWSDHNVRPADHPGVNGEYFFDQDGFVFGSPHLALYRRDVVVETCNRWGVALGSTGNDVPQATRDHLDEAGRGYWVYDTAKLVNILLQLDGHRLCHREVPELLHIGGVAHYLAPPSSAPAAADRPPAWGEGPDWGEAPTMRARHALARYTAEVMTERAAGRPAPPTPSDVEPALVPRFDAVREALADLDLTPGAP